MIPIRHDWPGRRSGGSRRQVHSMTIHMRRRAPGSGSFPVFPILEAFALALLLCSGAGVRAASDPISTADAGTQKAEAPRAEPAPVAGRHLSFATLGWHPPQTGAQALARFKASEDTSPEIQRGGDTLVVPKPDLVFVLKAGERIPGFDRGPGAGRLSIEFIFGPDGPIIFTPLAGGAYCQMSFGIALETGRPLEMQRADWGDTQYPRGTVRITNRELERAH